MTARKPVNPACTGNTSCLMLGHVRWSKGGSLTEQVHITAGQGATLIDDASPNMVCYSRLIAETATHFHERHTMTATVSTARIILDIATGDGHTAALSNGEYADDTVRITSDTRTLYVNGDIDEGWMTWTSYATGAEEDGFIATGGSAFTAHEVAHAIRAGLAA